MKFLFLAIGLLFVAGSATAQDSLLEERMPFSDDTAANPF